MAVRVGPCTLSFFEACSAFTRVAGLHTRAGTNSETLIEGLKMLLQTARFASVGEVAAVGLCTHWKSDALCTAHAKIPDL